MCFINFIRNKLWFTLLICQDSLTRLSLSLVERHSFSFYSHSIYFFLFSLYFGIRTNPRIKYGKPTKKIGQNGCLAIELAELTRRLCCCSCCCCSCRRHPRYRHRSRFRGADPSRSAWRRTRRPRQWRRAYRYHATVRGGHAPSDWQTGGAEEGRSEEECRSNRGSCDCGRKWPATTWRRCTQATQYIRVGWPNSPEWFLL